MRLSAECYTDQILKIPTQFGRVYALVHDAEREKMAVPGRQVAGERRDAVQGTRFGMNVPVCECCLHTLAQGAVFPRYGKCRVQVLEYLRTAVGIVQEAHDEFRSGIVIQREAATVGYLVAVGLHSQLGNQVVDKCHSLLSARILLSRECCYLIEETLGIDVLAVFKEGLQHLVDGMGPIPMLLH